tara:strand:+ start:651 stop:1247 length:597 start_codon:yes stop_codon:yes gene_type:complete
MTGITYTYLNNRKAQFFSHFYDVFISLGYDEVSATANTEQACKRLDAGLGKLYGNRNVHQLVRMKRQVRNEIRNAIMFRPAQIKKKEYYEKEYAERAKKFHDNNQSIFSFEHCYGSKLRVRFADFAHLFKITPLFAVEAAKKNNDQSQSLKDPLDAARELLASDKDCKRAIDHIKHLILSHNDKLGGKDKLDLISLII